MIYILHGENIELSQKRLKDISANYKSYPKIRISNEDLESLLQHINAVDIFSANKLIIADDFISKGLLKPKHAANIIGNNVLILWEKKELTATNLKSWSKIANVEIFKLPSMLYYFLDSIKNSPTEPIKLLNKLTPKDETNILWQLINRISLLLLCKMGLGAETASKFAGRPIAPWQWNKIATQASHINIEILRQMYNSALKLDYLNKTGKTAIEQKTLISLLLFKYLKG